MLRDLRGVAKAGCLGLAVAVLGAWRWKEMRRGKSLRRSTCVTCVIWVDGGEIDKLINSLDVQGQAKTLEEDLEVELVPE